MPAPSDRTSNWFFAGFTASARGPGSTGKVLTTLAPIQSPRWTHARARAAANPAAGGPDGSSLYRCSATASPIRAPCRLINSRTDVYSSECRSYAERLLVTESRAGVRLIRSLHSNAGGCPDSVRSYGLESSPSTTDPVAHLGPDAISEMDSRITTPRSRRPAQGAHSNRNLCLSGDELQEHRLKGLLGTKQRGAPCPLTLLQRRRFDAHVIGCPQ